MRKLRLPAMMCLSSILSRPSYFLKPHIFRIGKYFVVGGGGGHNEGGV